MSPFLACAVVVAAVPILGLTFLALACAINARIEEDFWYEFWHTTPVTEGATEGEVIRIEERYFLRKAA